MKFTCTIEIYKPKDKVAELFVNPKYLKEYQDGFISKELLEGTEGHNEAKSKMIYKMGKNQMVITETILENNLPDSFFANYHHKHMDNTMLCRFESIDDNTTKYISEINYTAFRGFVPKALAYLFPSMFKKQVKKWLVNFKNYAERNEAN
ncbi:SRPBCC family protein [Formosa maritima]|uniref:SRPBCC family protein n=1 Tax=Formosa maritima TaxID=2592046 RepID=A0A5D0GJI6_9FLAO|nr:SRPBCC family protein [Formosa maritima]TYA59134.1 SRPBCC family protein [Formosa maritima]